MMALNAAAFVLVAMGAASLAQEEPPKLKIEPSEPRIRRDIGSTAFITCQAADGFEDLVDEMVWVDPQGIEVPAEQQRIHTSEYVPGRGRELYVMNVQEQDSGSYTCKARYATSQEVSIAFELVVYMGIRWEDAPQDQNPIEGTQAKIKCVVRANPVAVVEWFKDGLALRSGGRYVVDQDGLVIEDISSEDDGSYVCRAKVPSEGALEERIIKVEVYSPPQILEPEPDSQWEVTEKEAGSIPCHTSGRPTPTVTWTDPDNDDAAAVDGLSVDPRDGTLNFDPANRDMGGEYKCIAENAVGRVETAVQVVVIVKPEIIRYENVTENQEQTAVLECKAGGSPLPSIVFRKLSRDKPFEMGTAADDQRITVSERVEDGYKIGSLTITELTRADDGLYECIASNKGGRHLLNGHITTQFLPDFTNSPIREMYSWNNHPVNLTCVAESIPNATITWEFKRRIVEQRLDSNIEQIGNGPTSVLRVIPTDPTYYGIFTCKASNLVGINTLNIELFEATVPSMLTDVQFGEVTATTVRFTMNGPASDGGLPLVAYAVQYKEAGQSWDTKRERLWPVGTTYVLDDLRPEIVFVFRFAAKNDVGLGEWSAELTMVMPKIDVPERPTIMLQDLSMKPADEPDMVVSSEHSDSYTVQWQAGANNGEKIDNFEISYEEVSSTKTGWRSVADKRSSVVDFPGTHTFTVSDLKPETHYRLHLRAHNKMGYGKPAQLIVLTAPGPAPGAADAARDADPPSQPAVASSVVIGVVVGVLLVLLLLADLTCYATRSRGLLHALCSRARHRSGNAKLTNEELHSEKEPLQEGQQGNGNSTANESEVPAVAVQGADAPEKDSPV